MNVIVIVGRVGKDPEAKQTQSGVSVANFSVAVTQDFKTNGERLTDWFEIVAWRQTADFVGSYVRKGALVAVSGRMQRRQYEAQDGSKRTVWELVADKVNKLSRDDDAPARSGQAQQNEEVFDDPFADS